MQRDGLFEEVLADALERPEIVTALEHPDAPEREDLAAIARGQRQALLVSVQAAEAEFRAAEARRRQAADRRWLARAGAYAALLVLLLFWTGSAFCVEWAGLYTRPSYRLTGGDLWGGIVAALLIPAVVSVLIGWIRWRGARSDLPNLREDPGYGEAYMSAAWETFDTSATATTLLAALFGALGAGSVLWDYSHHRPIPDNVEPFIPSGVWPWGVSFAIALVVLKVIRLIWEEVLAAAVARSLGEGAVGVRQRRDGLAASAKLAGWRSALTEAVLSCVRGAASSRIKLRSGTVLEPLANAEGLRQVRGYGTNAYHVTTRAERELVAVAEGMDNGSIALAGPRGIGKSSVLHRFCATPGPSPRGPVVSVPVLFERREFMLYLFDQVCQFALDSGQALGRARANQEWIRYQRTRSGALSAGGGWGPFTLGASRGSSLAEQQAPYPAIVHRLREFLEELTQAFALSRPGERLVLGIDELDKITPISRAREFLDEIKAVFDVRGWLFVLSVSDEALREADLARADRRDAFDSAVDETVRIGPLTYAGSVELIGIRAIGMPEPFTALFHCLSGGRPRDLLRNARAAAVYAARTERTLAQVAARLIERELERRASSTGLATDADIYHLLADVFTDALTAEAVRRAAAPSAPGSFDDLADFVQAAENLHSTDLQEYQRRLEEIRQAWQ